MYTFKILMGYLALIFTAIPAMAQGRTYTLPAPSGVPDGSRLVLFGQGWKGENSPENPVVRGGRVTIRGDIGASSIFGNFILPDGNWFQVEKLSGVPKGWAARIIAGDCKGDALACDGVEAFLDQDTFALVAPITTNGANSSFTVSVQGGQACLQLPSRLNSISFSGARGSRSVVGLATGGPKGLVNVGRLLRETIPVGVVDGGQGSAQVVALTKVGGNRWCLPVQRGQIFQFAYRANGGGIQAWSTVGAARLRGPVRKLDGNAPRPVGPYAYQAQ
ncbi:MAG: hypothetical protein RJB24_236 [Candidatus Parcubacteria bacterium]